MKHTDEFFNDKNISVAIDILSDLLKIDNKKLTSEFKKYDYSGVDYFDKILKKLAKKSTEDIKEIRWYRLADAYDLMGQAYPIV